MHSAIHYKCLAKGRQPKHNIFLDRVIPKHLTEVGDSDDMTQNMLTF